MGIGWQNVLPYPVRVELEDLGNGISWGEVLENFRVHFRSRTEDSEVRWVTYLRVREKWILDAIRQISGRVGTLLWLRYGIVQEEVFGWNILLSPKTAGCIDDLRWATLQLLNAQGEPEEMLVIGDMRP